MKVLVAEDDQITRTLLETLLRSWGYDVLTASDGLSALQFMESPDPPKLLIVDWGMPELTGLQLCERIRETGNSSCPHIILLTGRTDSADLVAAFEAGANDYIRKPFDRRELQARIKVGHAIVDSIMIEERLKHFFEISLDIFCIAGLDGYLRVMNPRLCELLGYTEDELKSRSYFDFFHPDDAPLAQAEVERLGTGELVVDFRCRSRAKDGTDHWIEWNARADVSQGLLYAVGRDISERLRTEEELKYRENRENVLLNRIPAMISIKGLDGRYEFVNQRHADVFSGDVETAIGKTAKDFFSGKDSRLIERQEQEIIRTGKTLTTTATVPRPDGDHTYVSIRFPLRDGVGRICGTASISTDVTEQLHAKEREREIEMACAFQNLLYPKLGPTISGFEISGAAKPATGLCGDYYDYFAIGPQRLVVGIGDVTGHGIGPALQMTKVSCAIRILAQMDRSLSDIVAHVNQDLCKSLPDCNFVTLFLAEIDLSKHELTYIGAGHESIQVRADGSSSRLESTHTVLGIDPTAQFSGVKKVQIVPGDVLLFLTDGLTETMNLTKTQFGMERITELVCRYRQDHPQVIINSIFQAADEFSGKSIHIDDITAVAVKILE